ncbi:hypothetical protein ACVGW6_16810, partial [Enterobacter intestinihominis]
NWRKSPLGDRRRRVSLLWRVGGFPLTAHKKPKKKKPRYCIATPQKKTKKTQPGGFFNCKKLKFQPKKFKKKNKPKPLKYKKKTNQQNIPIIFYLLFIIKKKRGGG